MSSAKVLVIGSPAGLQGRFVGAISQVKVRSSARTTSGEDFVPMDFGRIKIDDQLDLQIFGVERDRVGVIVDAIAPGIVGALLLAEPADTSDPHFSSQALDELSEKGIFTVIARTSAEIDPTGLAGALSLNGNDLVDCVNLDRESAKNALVKLFEAVLEAAESAA